MNCSRRSELIDPTSAREGARMADHKPDWELRCRIIEKGGDKEEHPVDAIL